MTVEGCPRCGDQTLWRMGRQHLTGELVGWCRLCGHTWNIVEQNVFRCDDPEGQWIKDQENDAQASLDELEAERHLAPGREKL